MLRRNICNEAGARSDGLMFVSVLFISAFTYIALTTNPVYTGIGVGDRAPDLTGQVWDGNSWTDFDLQDNIDSMWSEGDAGTYYMIEFMDTNCGYCKTSAKDFILPEQSRWTGENPTRSMPENITVEFLAVSIALHDGSEGWDYGRTEITDFRAEYDHTFGYMDDHDNENRDEWEIPGTPTYFLVAPNGIILYATPDAEQGFSVWDAMEYEIPTGGGQ
jgi:hypothetical protein